MSRRRSARQTAAPLQLRFRTSALAEVLTEITGNPDSSGLPRIVNLIPLVIREDSGNTRMNPDAAINVLVRFWAVETVLRGIVLQNAGVSEKQLDEAAVRYFAEFMHELGTRSAGMEGSK